MHPMPQPSPVVNWSIPNQLIDQFPAAVVVINSLPFRGRIDRLPPSQPHRQHRRQTSKRGVHAAVVSYVLATPAESTAQKKRHGLMIAELSGLGNRRVVMSFIERMRQAAKEMEATPTDPWRKVLEPFVRGVDAVSTVALLDLVDARHTTSNARRVAATMYALGFVKIQSRKLQPGGFRDTVARGWARPTRSLPEKVKSQQGTRSNLANPGDDDVV
jgi:hypothetical protein